MPVELKVPSVGESITKVVIGAWRKREGESADRDESLVEIETDKATIELPAPVAGTIAKILKRDGDSAEVGEVIGYMESGAAPPARKSSASAAPAKAEPAREGRPPAVAARGTQPEPAPRAAAAAAAATAKGEPHIMPAARRAMAQSGLQPGAVAGSGPGGRVLKEDVEGAVEDGGPISPAAAAASDAAVRSGSGTVQTTTTAARRSPAAPATGGNGAAAGPSTPAGPREEQAVPMTPLRRRVAQRLVESQHTAALLTTFNEVDMQSAMQLRNQHKETFEKRYGVKLGFMSFFVKAAIDALKQFPQLNAEIREQPGADNEVVPHIIYRNYYDIGVAVSGGKGLVVPVIRSAERLSFAQIEQQIADFGARGRDNKLKLEELQGGTFTISNGGVFGSLMSTPIINPPQSGILGLHAIQDRPVARDGQVVIRPMMYIALTYDHRIVDGREAVTFLRRIKECVEDPTRMLIEI